jgi:hypothetical protein
VSQPDNDSNQSAITVTKGLTITKGSKPLSTPDRHAGLLPIGDRTHPTITDNSVASYAFADMWDVDYDIAGVPVVDI